MHGRCCMLLLVVGCLTGIPGGYRIFHTIQSCLRVQPYGYDSYVYPGYPGSTKFSKLSHRCPDNSNNSDKINSNNALCTKSKLC